MLSPYNFHYWTLYGKIQIEKCKFDEAAIVYII